MMWHTACKICIWQGCKPLDVQTLPPGYTARVTPANSNLWTGTFGVLNGFFLTRLPNPLNIISVATIALVTGIALRVARGTTVPAPIGGLALIPTSFLAFNPPMLVVAYAWAGAGTVVLAALVYGRRGTRRLVGWLIRAAPWVVVLNAWWLVPLA